MDFIERLATTVEEATAEALKILDIKEEDAVITVLDPGSKGIFLGIGAKPAKVRVEKKPEPVDIIRNFVKEVTLAMGLAINVEVHKRERHVYVNLTGENMGILVGKRGQTLDALQYITNLAMGKLGNLQTGIVVDTENYRRRRKETLETLARATARKSRDKKQTIKLEPMPRFERHIIHSVLQNDKTIRTYSEGYEPNRYVVVTPKH